MATGRAVRDVSEDSYALTLWTWWHLEQQEKIRGIRREAERQDAAVLAAFAQHSPERLIELQRGFQDRVMRTGRREDPDVRARRVAEMVEAHSRLRPLTPDEAKASGLPTDQ